MSPRVRRLAVVAVLAVVALAVCLPRSAAAQSAAGTWRTLRTEHYRVHYPLPAEAWTLRAAARLESIHRQVAAAVGYDPPQVVDVVVMDPVARANGSAWAIVDRPRMVLWTTPPAAGSGIGFYDDWGELLLTHEVVHLTHLLRPSRNPLQALLTRIVPVTPIARRLPRWVTEGYATYLEGRLTRTGRPNSDLRAAILRRWAQLGELPSYGAMSGADTWLGQSMAYLMGSAYLEWLVERGGPGALRDLWARSTARYDRGFEEAFVGVFGDRPAKLYNRFRAELTYRAMAVEAELAPHVVEGELWQDLGWSSGPPALSPDGERVAMVLRGREVPARLVVWSTAPDDKTYEAWLEKRQEILDRDPEDVAAVERGPLARKPLHTLHERDGAEPSTPRWSADGRSLVYVRFEPDADGFLHPDLFRWAPEAGEVERLTTLADVRDPDPAPDGGWAVAIRTRYGASQLVRVDLESGAITELTPATVAEVYDQPRISPSGARLAVLVHRDRAWRLVVRDLATGAERELPVPPAATLTTPAWGADDDTLFVTVGEDGFLDLARFDLRDGSRHRVTRTLGAAIAPAPTPDGSAVFYLGLESDGLDLRRLDLATAPAPADVAITVDAGFAPAVRPSPPAEVEGFVAAELAAPEPYGVGPQDTTWLVGGGWSPSAAVLEAGVRGGDPIGRVEWSLLGETGDGAEGAAAAVTWRGLPVALRAAVGHRRETPSEQPTEVPGLGDALDLDRTGLALGAAWDRRGRGSAIGVALDAWVGELEPLGAATLDREAARLGIAYRRRQERSGWRFEEGVAGSVTAGSTGDDGWRRHALRLDLAAGRRDDWRVGLAWSRHGASGVATDLERWQLGGLQGDAGLLTPRIESPALPAGTRVGDEHESQRLDLQLGELPVTAFFTRHRVWNDPDPDHGDWLRLTGLDLTLDRPSWPLVGLPPIELRAGVAYVLDPPFEDDVQGWLSLRWRP